MREMEIEKFESYLKFERLIYQSILFSLANEGSLESGNIDLDLYREDMHNRLQGVHLNVQLKFGDSVREKYHTWIETLKKMKRGDLETSPVFRESALKELFDLLNVMRSELGMENYSFQNWKEENFFVSSTNILN